MSTRTFLLNLIDQVVQRFQIAALAQNVNHLCVDLNVRLNLLRGHFIQYSFEIFCRSIIDVVQYTAEQPHESDVNWLNSRRLHLVIPVNRLFEISFFG